MPAIEPSIDSSAKSGLLCRVGHRSCGGCCWASEISREDLGPRLARHRRLFGKLRSSARVPSRIRLLLYELRVRLGLDLVLAIVQWIPGLRGRLRGWFAADVVCAFAAFENENHQQVGCLIHPSRFGGEDVRQRSAFRLLRHFGCGAADYSCRACHQYSSGDSDEQASMLQQLPSDGWFDYSRAVVSLNLQLQEPDAIDSDEPDPTRNHTREPACPSSFTRQ